MNQKVVVMGVAGCGKSTLGTHLARVLGCELIEGDNYHPAANLAKMAGGFPLDDADRWPWLDRLGEVVQQRSGNVVLSCSALKRSYRDLLRAVIPELRLVYVQITQQQAADRVAARPGHVFPASLVDSQFRALEPPHGEPGVLCVDACAATALQIETVLAWLAETRKSQPVTS